MNPIRSMLRLLAVAALALSFTAPPALASTNHENTISKSLTVQSAPVSQPEQSSRNPLGPLGTMSVLGFGVAGFAEAKKLAARKLTLDRTYLFNDVLYGPGRNVQVPEGFPEIDDEGNVVHEPNSVAERNAKRMRTPAPAGTNALSDRTISGKSLEELQAMSKEELVDLANELDLEIVRGNDEEGDPLKADYVTALSAPSAEAK